MDEGVKHPMQDVLDFIVHFAGSEDTFLNGCCYWFAFILQTRFDNNGYFVDIFYEPVDGHFITRFIAQKKDTLSDDVRFFDIRGDVTDLYSESELENMWLLQRTDERRWTKLMCDCRDFIEPENYPRWLKYTPPKID